MAAVIRPPGARAKSGIQHFAAGVVFSVVAVELLPDVVRTHSAVHVGGGFAAGVIVMLLLRRWTESRAATAGHSAAGLLVAVGVDVLLDGLLLGIAFAAGAKEGVLLTLALSLELLSLGLAITGTLLGRGATRVRAAGTPVLIGLLLTVGAIIGDTILHNAPSAALAGVLSFGCAALLFLVTEGLLVEAHEIPETPIMTGMFFAGFLLFLLLGMST